MPTVQYNPILKYLLMIPLFPIDGAYSLCRKACLDIFEEYEIHCRGLSYFKYRHHFIRDVLFDIFWWAEIFVRNEALVNFINYSQVGFFFLNKMRHNYGVTSFIDISR